MSIEPDHTIRIVEASPTGFTFQVVPAYTPESPPVVLLSGPAGRIKPKLLDATDLTYRVEFSEDQLEAPGRYLFVIEGINRFGRRMTGAVIEGTEEPYISLDELLLRDYEVLVFSDQPSTDTVLHYLVGRMPDHFRVDLVKIDGEQLPNRVYSFNGNFFCTFELPVDDGYHQMELVVRGRFLEYKITKELYALSGFLFPSGGLPIKTSIRLADPAYYVVQPGDTLYDIASRFRTTVGYLMIINHITDPNNIYAGTRLKIGWVDFGESPLRIEINLRKAKLTLYYGEKELSSFPVALGRSDATPPGDYRIIYKERDPALYWYGEYIPPGTITNGLGSYWLQLSQPQYGIHGTTKPWEIGKRISHGCIRMMDDQAGIIYALASVGTPVHVVARAEDGEGLNEQETLFETDGS